MESGCWSCDTLRVMELSGKEVALPPGETAVNTVLECLFAGDHITLKKPFERDFFDAPPDDLTIHLQQEKQKNKQTQT